MKEAYYFSHDANARHDDKILELRAEFGWEGYGLFWAIIETLRDCSNYTFPSNAKAGLALSLSIDKTKLEKFISACLELRLLIEDDGFFYSESLMKRMEDIDEKRRKRAEAGRKGGNAKAMLKQRSSNHVAKASKESKVKESKEEEINIKAAAKTKGHLFIESEYSDLQKFIAAFPADYLAKDFPGVDLAYYHDVIMDWSEAGGHKKVNWAAAAKGWMRRDKAKGELKLKASHAHHQKQMVY